MTLNNIKKIIVIVSFLLLALSYFVSPITSGMTIKEAGRATTDPYSGLPACECPQLEVQGCYCDRQ